MNLDSYQQAVVAYTRGHGRVVAGAGAGKTRVLIERAVLLTTDCYPEHILSLAYNKSAAEVTRTRLEQRAPALASRFAVSTFHAWCLHIAHRWWPGHPRLMKDRILGTPGNPSPAGPAIRLIETGKLDVYWRDALAVHAVLTEALIAVHDHDAARAYLREHLHLVGVNDLLLFHEKWTEYKANERWIEFADMLGFIATEILQRPTDPHVAALRQLYAHVQVDEGQDTNPARDLVGNWVSSYASARTPPQCAAAIAEAPGTCRSSLVVGDHRQAIYSFTGACPTIFQDEGRDLLVLPTNYRSTPQVVDAGNAVVAGVDWNGDARTASCVPRPFAPSGEPVQVWGPDICSTPADEYACIFEDIQRRAAALRHWSDFAILARTNALLVGLEIAGVARGVPVRVAGTSGGIWGTSMGQHFLAFLRGAEDRLDWGLLEVANKPNRFLKKKELGATLSGILPGESLQARLLGGPAPSQGIHRLAKDLSDLSRMPWTGRCGQIEKWVKSGAKSSALKGSDQDYTDALKCLRDAAVSLGSVEAIEDHIKKLARAEKQDSVLLSTIHGAKGAEYPVVYVAGARVGILPHKNAVNHEEERRLLYVAITRAEQVCIVSTGGKRSPFLAALEKVR